jgi:hypothetical protein
LSVLSGAIRRGGANPPIRPRHVAHQGCGLRAGQELMRPSRQYIGYQFRTLFVICRRLEIRSQSGVVGTFPHRNGILATFSFGIDVRHDDRAMEGFPVFP